MGSDVNSPRDVASPVVKPIDVSMSSGNGGPDGGHTCAVQENGQVKCWGSGSYGQLGNGTSPSFASAPVTVLGISNAVKVYAASSGYSTAYGRSCALLADGTIKCWGYLPSAGQYATPVGIG
jgi:hypothetical protein